MQVTSPLYESIWGKYAQFVFRRHPHVRFQGAENCPGILARFNKANVRATPFMQTVRQSFKTAITEYNGTTIAQRRVFTEWGDFFSYTDPITGMVKKMNCREWFIRFACQQLIAHSILETYTPRYEVDPDGIVYDRNVAPTSIVQTASPAKLTLHFAQGANTWVMVNITPGVDPSYEVPPVGYDRDESQVVKLLDADNIVEFTGMEAGKRYFIEQVFLWSDAVSGYASIGKSHKFYVDFTAV